jgi:glycosyltransferase involved in cell wall biosynthesis
VYPGTLSEVHGVDIAVRAVHRVRTTTDVPVEFHIYGAGPKGYVEKLEALAAELALDGVVFFHPRVSTTEYAELLKSMDAGVVPKRDGVFADLAMSTKLMEFAAVGLPAIASRTMPDTLFFDDRMVAFFEPGNEQQLADAIVMLHRDPGYRTGLARSAQRVFDVHNWHNEKAKLWSVYRGLLTGCRGTNPNGASGS